MKKHTRTEKINGELAERSLSVKASRLVEGTDPLDIFEIETEDGPRYDMTGGFGELDGVTFEELQESLEELADELADAADEYTFTRAGEEFDPDEDSALWEAIVSYMDDDIREAIHAKLAPCTNAVFLSAYLHREEAAGRTEYRDLLENEFCITAEE